MKNFPIRTRLWISLGAMLCLLILVAGANVLHVRYINQKIRLINETAFPAAASSLNLKMATHKAMELLNAAAIASRKDILQKLPELEGEIFSQLATIKSLENSGFLEPGKNIVILSHYITAKEAGWENISPSSSGNF